MILNYSYAVFPTEEQLECLESTLYICRHTYNSALLDKQNYYKRNKKNYTRAKLQKQLIVDKKKHALLKSVHSQPLQEVFFRVEKAYKNFFEQRANYPKIKKAKDYNSFTFTQFGLRNVNPKTGKPSFYGAHFDENENLFLSKIGSVKIFLHRPIDGAIKQVVIKRKGKRWFAIFSVERHVDHPSFSSEPIGIDVGINTFAFLSNEKTIDNPRHLRKKEKALQKAQRRLSKMKRYSNNWKKQLHQVQKLHLKVANQRKDFLHKASYRLAKVHSIICVEDLNIRNMVKNKRLAKSISDAGWGNFRNMLHYKCEKYGGILIVVNPKYTTQECSSCRIRVKKSLSLRTHICKSCGTILDRDHNAAMNIKHAGLAKLEPLAT